MDISKLPRFSKTTTTTTNAPAEAGEPADVGAAPAPVQAQVGGWCVQCGAPNVAGSRFCNGCGAALPAQVPAVPYAAPATPTPQPGIGAEVWLSAIIGIVLMLFGLSFARWGLTALFGGTYHTNVKWTAGPKAGEEVAYWELEGFTALQDTAIFVFGLAMVLEAGVLAAVHSRLRGKRALLVLAIAITLVATLLNLIVAGKLLANGALPLLSLLAVGFGGYIAIYEWRLLQYFRPTRAA